MGIECGTCECGNEEQAEKVEAAEAEAAEAAAELDKTARRDASSLQLELAPRPQWLPRQGGQQREPEFLEHPELWALTSDQLVKFAQAVKETAKYYEMKIAPGTKWSEAGSVNHYELSIEFIIPWSTNTGSSIALLMNPKGLQAQAMISHVILSIVRNASGL